MNEGANPTVIGLVTQGLAEVKEAVTQLSRDLHGTLARLPTDYVPRREVERRFDDLIIDLGAEQAAREQAVKALVEAQDKAALAAASHRRWLIGTVLTVLIALLGFGIDLAGHTLG
jgi:hypothetical protein